MPIDKPIQVEKLLPEADMHVRPEGECSSFILLGPASRSCESLNMRCVPLRAPAILLGGAAGNHALSGGHILYSSYWVHETGDSRSGCLQASGDEPLWVAPLCDTLSLPGSSDFRSKRTF